MTNTNLLKAKMVENGDDSFVTSLSRLLDITRPTATDRLKGRSAFNQNEIKIIADNYNLSPEDIVRIFLE